LDGRGDGQGDRD
jgi:hypothetical protein